MRRDPAKAILVLDLLTEFFGEFGHRWIVGMYEDRYGGRCLASALHHVSTEAQLSDDEAEHYLCRALPAGYTDLDLFNDDCRCYDEIRAVIVAAREIAQAENDAMTDAEIGRAMRYLLCQSCGALHLGTPAATTDRCAHCQGSKFRLASIEMVTQPIPSVRWPRPFTAEDIEKIERAARGGCDGPVP